LLQEEAAEAKKQLLREKQKWQKQRAAIKQQALFPLLFPSLFLWRALASSVRSRVSSPPPQVSLSSSAFEKRKAELSKNENIKKIEAQETKLKTTSQTTFQLEDCMLFALSSRSKHLCLLATLTDFSFLPLVAHLPARP
jgi:hypothetical protein